MRRKKTTGGLATRLAGGAVGGVLAEALTTMVMKNFSPVISNVVLVAGGAVLPEVASVKGLQEVGTGMIAIGAANLANQYIFTKEPNPAATAGTPFSRFNNAIGSGVDPFYQRMINPASDMAITGRTRAKKKENQVVL